MSSTFSPSLRLELVGDGDQSGIWGQTTNQNLGALVEQAITGVVNITMLDANYTLTNFNGVADEARNAVLVVDGVLTQQRNLIAPLVEKIYSIKNSTTGGFGVQIIGTSGVGVVIPNNQTTPVYCDGTNFYALATGTAGNFSVAGTLSVAGTSTLTGNAAMGGTLSVAGTSTLTGNTTVGGTLSVGSTLGVTGNAAMGGTLAVALPLTATSGIISGSGAAPTFGAYLASNQSITSGVITKVNIDTEEWDTNSNFAAGRFTPTVAGYYQINGGIYLAGVANTQSAGFVYIYKNGSAYKQSSAGLYSYSSISSGNGTISSLVYLNGSTDYVELWGRNVQTGPVFGGGSGLTYFNGAFVRSA